MDNLRVSAGRVGIILLALFLILFGFSGLVGIAIPAWVGFSLALLAGICLFIGNLS